MPYFEEAQKELEQSLEGLSQSLEHPTTRGSRLNPNRGRNSRVIPFPAANVDENRFPNFRYLCVSDARVDPGCCLLQNLRTLVLYSTHSEALRLSGDQLLDILEECPEIEKLDVSYISWTHDPIARPMTQPRTLLSLLRFARLEVFEQDFDVVMKMLRRFSFPAEAKVWIDIQSSPGEFDEPELPESTVQMLLEAALLAVRPSKEPLWRLGIVCQEGHAGLFGSISGSQGSLYLQTSRQRDAPGLAIEIVDRLLSQDLSRLTALEINLAGIEMISEEWWCTLFARTPELRQLSLGSKDGLINALAALQNMAPATSNPPSILLPHLTELFSRDKDIPEIRPDHIRRRNHLDDPDSPAHHLTKCLKTREVCGFRLEKLEILAPALAGALQADFSEVINQYITVVDPRTFTPSVFLLHPRSIWAWETRLF